jgi:hypothetical protein
MQIISNNKLAYTLQYDHGGIAGSLIYLDESLHEAMLSCDKEYLIVKQTNGLWLTRETGSAAETAMCKVKIGGTMALLIGNKQYIFRKPFNWKLRLIMLNTEKEEVLAFLPTANWKLHAYNYVLQLNSEFIKETDCFIILQALHCAVCSMAMMNGGITSAVVF